MTPRFYLLSGILFLVVVASTVLTHYGHERSGMLLLGIYVGILLYLAS